MLTAASYVLLLSLIDIFSNLTVVVRLVCFAFFVMSLNTCFICDEGFTENNGVIVKRKGIMTFINSSNIRRGGKADVVKHLESVKVHEKCRKQYSRIECINPQNILSQSLCSPVKRKLRSTKPSFNFKETCFFFVKKN